MVTAIQDPRSLITPDCFDIGAKILYARHYLEGIKSEFALRLYEHHLKVWNGLNEIDPPKQGLEAYTNEFHSIIDAMKGGTFDFSKSPIPINAKGKVINGRHRLAAAIACKAAVMVEDAPDSAGQEMCSYPYLLNKGLERDYADAMATEYVRVRENAYIACVFSPHKSETILETLREHGTPVYWKEIGLRGEGAFNLMRELYLDEPWVLDWRSSFAGAKEKARLCLTGNNRVGVYLFECKSLPQVLECKKALRALFEGSQHSLHINDTQAETRRLAGVLFNANSLHFLNHSRSQQYPGFQSMLEEYRAFLEGRDGELFAVDGSALLAAYGLRECRDLDFLDKTGVSGPSNQVNNHNEELIYHTKSVDDILFNPESHFWHSGVKFASLGVLKEMKRKRNEPKDQRDIALIDRENKWMGAVRKFLERSFKRVTGGKK